MVNLTLHAACSNDLNMLRQLAEQIWKPYYSAFFPVEKLERLFAGMYDPDKLRNWLETPGNTYCTIHVDNVDNPIGFCAFCIEKGQLWLDKLYIDASLRKKNLGSEIIRIITKQAMDKDCHEIALRVYRMNKPAIFFYLKNGFVIERAVDYAGLNGAIYPDYYMSKQLSSRL